MNNKITHVVTKLYLPDSVKIQKRKLYITESGKNQIILYDLDNNYKSKLNLDTILKLHEPVNCTPVDDKLFICDWFNHRIIVKENEKTNQVGIPGKINRPIFTILRFFKTIGMSPTYNKIHFEKIKKNNSVFDFNKWNISIVYYLLNMNMLLKNYFQNLLIDKPNDCLYYKNKLYISQKDNNCLTIINDYENLNEIYHYTFYSDKKLLGRLGQMYRLKDMIYFCDETNSRIGIFYLNKISFVQLDLNIKPFSITFCKSKFFISSINTIFVFDEKWKFIKEIKIDGEIHGICSDDSDLYIADRKNGCILKIKI